MVMIYNKPAEPQMYMVSNTDIAKSDAEINELLPDAAPGTIISVAGYSQMKQKDADGAWIAL